MAPQSSGAKRPPTEAAGPRRLPMLLRRAWYGLNQTFRRRIAHTAATPDQYTVLRILIEHHQAGLTQSELTQLMSSDPNTIASLLERMERAGWIERKSHESDRRAHRLQVHPAGRRKYRQLREIALKLQTDVLSVLPEAERERFLEELAKVADACRAAAAREGKE